MIKKFKDKKSEELKKEKAEWLRKISPLYHLVLTWIEEVERKNMKEKIKKISITNHKEGKLVTGFLFLRIFTILVKSFRFSIIRIFPFSTYFLACSILRIPKKISKNC
jgi:hypothetical protein